IRLTVAAVARDDHSRALIAVRLVVVKTPVGDGADIHRLYRAIGLRDGQRAADAFGGLHVVAIPVRVVFAGHVANERVAAIGPPEAGPIVLIERQRLFGQWLGVHGP